MNKLITGGYTAPEARDILFQAGVQALQNRAGYVPRKVADSVLVAHAQSAHPNPLTALRRKPKYVAFIGQHDPLEEVMRHYGMPAARTYQIRPVWDADVQQFVDTEVASNSILDMLAAVRRYVAQADARFKQIGQCIKIISS